MKCRFPFVVWLNSWKSDGLDHRTHTKAKQLNLTSTIVSHIDRHQGCVFSMGITFAASAMNAGYQPYNWWPKLFYNLPSLRRLLVSKRGKEEKQNNKALAAIRTGLFSIFCLMTRCIKRYWNLAGAWGHLYQLGTDGCYHLSFQSISTDAVRIPNFVVVQCDYSGKFRYWNINRVSYWGHLHVLQFLSCPTFSPRTFLSQRVERVPCKLV